MDLQIIGKFIKEQRKAKELTQLQLSEKLNVSEKTISKWECGNGFPDTSLMLPLCKELDISANELLSGKKLTTNEYKQLAEDNLIKLTSEQERSYKFLLTVETVLGYMASITFMILIFVASFIDMATWLRIVLIAIGLIQFVVAIHFCLCIEKDAGYYECAHCYNKYIPTYKQVLFSMHYGRTRYMKCPKCNKKSWQKKVTK
ncbi:MAG TPA: helix-turn-helix domain-containing protein [Candidatus Onthoplasma faecipullorum]|nr:helix-turn-helix domain-containing protein [Candidatus Onthoplasma faecipullorum]